MSGDDADAGRGERKRKRPGQRYLIRKARERDAAPALLVAYDLETTRIQAGTPRPLYLTAYAQGALHLSAAVRDMAHLAALISQHMLTLELEGAKFVAWAGNAFDAVIVAAALVTRPDYIIRPYLTRSKALRGLRVTMREAPPGWVRKTPPSWEFVDGAAMLGLAQTTLDKFLANFAPEWRKLTGVIDFEREDFDPANPRHVEYAERDSVGLWHGMQRAQRILLDNCNEPLRATMGAACIRIFQAHMPRMLVVEPLRGELVEIVRQEVMRGGYCHLARRYTGPVWKYDINQAYAAAMRDAKLPAGKAFHTVGGIHKFARVYVARIIATNPRNPVPFYARQRFGVALQSVFAETELSDVWITSIEHDQLKREGWSIRVIESYTWDDDFSMREYVDRLEHLRMTCDGGPSGPIGTMVKAVGNHSYGKTVEVLEPAEYLVSADRPDGFVPFLPPGADAPLAHVWERTLIAWDAPQSDDEAPGDRQQPPKPYHMPQIGAFITAHVRMVIRRAALIDPEAWIYADTDCAVFTRDVSGDLDIHPSRYGAWKIEEAGTRFAFIAKKVYSALPEDFDGAEKPTKRSAKGLNVKRLTHQDFADWFDGQPPVQDQVQRNSFVRVVSGAEMFRNLRRRGTAVPKLKR